MLISREHYLEASFSFFKLCSNNIVQVPSAKPWLNIALKFFHTNTLIKAMEILSTSITNVSIIKI